MPAARTLEAIPAGLRATVRALVKEEVARALAAQKERAPARASNRATLIVFSGDLDRVIASLVIATGAASMGMDVSMFFTFWGLSVLRRRRRFAGKDALARALTLLTPNGLESLGVSRGNFGGAGARALRMAMKSRKVASPEALFTEARDAGVRMVACSMSMDVLGIEKDELYPGVEVGGVATYLGDAADSRVTLFI